MYLAVVYNAGHSSEKFQDSLIPQLQQKHLQLLRCRIALGFDGFGGHRIFASQVFNRQGICVNHFAPPPSGLAGVSAPLLRADKTDSLRRRYWRL